MKSLSKVSIMGGFMGSGHGFDCEILMKSNLYEQLSEDSQSALSYKASEFAQKLHNQIEMEWMKEFKQKEREEEVGRLSSLFSQAGFETIYVKVVDNEYDNSAFYYTRPWLYVTTQRGIIKIGWRKRVINLDWSQSDIAVFGQDLFKGEESTVGDKFIHCWSEEKAVECLTKLREWRPETNSG